MIIGTQRKYSSDWHDHAKELYEIGLSLPAIGKAVGRASGTIKALVTNQVWRRKPERFNEGVARIALNGEEFRQVGESSWVSNLGRVVGMTKARPGVLLKIGKDKDGYFRVGANMRSWHGSRHVSRLVLEAFEGPCPDGMEAAHLDGSRENNAIENLAWVLHTENCGHKISHGTHQIGSSHPKSSITEFQALMTKRLVSVGATSRNIASVLGISKYTVDDIRSGKSWRHV